MSAAGERSVTIKIVAKILGDSFLVLLIDRDARRRFFREEVLFNIILSSLARHNAAHSFAHTSAEAHFW